MNSLSNGLPWMLAIMAAVTFGVLLLAFGSVLLPLKAVVTNVASVAATFGALVWIFQDGHLSGLLGFTATGYLEPTVLILVLAELFGLATDYEVFLLSRVREQWDATGDNTTAVATGLAAHRPDHHRGRRFADRGHRGIRHRPDRAHQAHRHRHVARHLPRRDPDPGAARAGHHAAPRPVELVGARPARAASTAGCASSRTRPSPGQFRF